MFFGCLYFLSEITSKSTSKKRREEKDLRREALWWARDKGWSWLTGETEEFNGVFVCRRESHTIAHVHYNTYWREHGSQKPFRLNLVLQGRKQATEASDSSGNSTERTPECCWGRASLGTFWEGPMRREWAQEAAQNHPPLSRDLCRNICGVDCAARLLQVAATSLGHEPHMHCYFLSVIHVKLLLAMLFKHLYEVLLGQCLWSPFSAFPDRPASPILQWNCGIKRRFSMVHWASVQKTTSVVFL